MNAFAEGFFQVLLGWLRAASQRAMSLLSDRGQGSFLVWLGGHWLWVVLILCIGGVLIDYTVWMLRWRPDLVWKTRSRHFFARLRGDEMNRGDVQQFYQGYENDNGLQSFFADPVPETAEGSAAEPEAAEPEEDTWGSGWIPIRDADLEDASADGGSDANTEHYVRKYRSGSRKTNKKPHRLLQEDDDSTSLSGLPPVISQQDAFHAPVYPENPQRHAGPQ